MDLSLLIFTLEIHQFCMKCIEFTTRAYNFKNLAVGSLILSAKTGVNSSYFPQKISTCPVLCCILTLSSSRVDWAYLEVLWIKKYIFLVDLVAHFFKIVCGLYEEMSRNSENSSPGNWILARNFLKNIFWPLFLRMDCSQLQDASIEPLCRVCSQKLKFLWPCVSFIGVSEYWALLGSRAEFSKFSASIEISARDPRSVQYCSFVKLYFSLK
jgi:hypothetical protein